MPWSVADLAYLAGFVDGEGHLNIRTNGTDTFLTKTVIGHFNVVGTDKETIEWITATFNGKISAYKPQTLHHKIRYTCHWSYQVAVPVLEAILPYLKTKRLQAQYYIEFAKNCTSYALEGRKMPFEVRKRAYELVVLCARVSNHKPKYKGVFDPGGKQLFDPAEND